MRNYVLSSRTSSRRHLGYRAAHQHNVNNVIIPTAIKKSSMLMQHCNWIWNTRKITYVN